VGTFCLTRKDSFYNTFDRSLRQLQKILTNCLMVLCTILTIENQTFKGGKMVKKMFVLAAMVVFTVGSAYAANCRNGKFAGSYVSSPNAPTDLFGDATVVHTFVFQLTLHSDGTASQYWTGLPDYELTLGTGSPWIGSWTCRNDGKLVVSLLRASYLPVAPGVNNPTNDIELLGHFRSTYLFTIDDDNTVTRIQARSRTYGPDEDPSIATGGTLGAISNAAVPYKRLVASDSDLTAP
jgi:hypothetical protein